MTTSLEKAREIMRKATPKPWGSSVGSGQYDSYWMEGPIVSSRDLAIADMDAVQTMRSLIEPLLDLWCAVSANDSRIGYDTETYKALANLAKVEL